MSLKKLVGYGVLIWVVVYLVATAFFAYKMLGAWWANALLVVLAAVMAGWAGTRISQPSRVAMLRYSVGWVVIAAVLDALLSVPFTGWTLFMMWSVWAAYAAILLIPVFTVRIPAVEPSQNPPQNP